MLVNGPNDVPKEYHIQVNIIVYLTGELISEGQMPVECVSVANKIEKFGKIGKNITMHFLPCFTHECIICHHALLLIFW